jgi:hypothetical protein
MVFSNMPSVLQSQNLQVKLLTAGRAGFSPAAGSFRRKSKADAATPGMMKRQNFAFLAFLAVEKSPCKFALPFGPFRD